MRREFVAILVALAGSASNGSSARAAEPTGAADCEADAETCGRRAFEAGIDAYQRKDYREAAAQFQRAYELRPHPIVLFNLALAQVKLELYVEAVAGFEQALSDRETPKDLASKIKQEKTEAERKIATIEIDAGSGAEIFVDEKSISGQPARARVNPGDHKLRVVASGREITNRSLHVSAGERLNVAVDRAREVVIEGGPKKKTEPVPHATKRPRPHSGLSPVWFYAGAGVTLVLGGITTWSALDTKRAFDDYERDLPKLSQSEVNQRVDDGHAKEVRTNVLIGATAVAGLGSIALAVFAVDWRGGDAESDAGIGLTPQGIRAFGRF